MLCPLAEMGQGNWEKGKDCLGKQGLSLSGF